MRIKRAFTLTELMIALALVALLCGMVVHQSMLSRSHVKQELYLLHQTCLYMQRHALLTHQRQQLIFDLYNHRYTYNGREHQLDRTVRFGILPVYGPPAQPTAPLDKVCTFKQNQINFYPDGNIDAGAIYLIDGSHKQLYALTIAVNPYSYLRTYCYADTWRLLN